MKTKTKIFPPLVNKLKLAAISAAPPLAHIAKSPVLLRNFVSWRFKKLLQANSETLGEKNLRFCNCVPLPATGRRKDGSTYETGMPGHVQIHKYKDSSKIAEEGETEVSHAYVGLKRCGSAMRCPVCGARIRYVRREEIQKIAKVMLKRDFSYIFVTLTAPHDVNTDPHEFIKKFQEANRILKGNRFKGEKWKEFAQRWGLAHSIRSIEVTDDKPGSGLKSGVHFHSHTVNFCERPVFSEEDAAKLRDEFAARWVDALLKVGLITEAEKAKTFEHGVDVQRPKAMVDGKIVELSDPEMIQKLIDYVCKGASFELSPGTVGGKSGRKDERISHWELMRIALTERPDLQPRLLRIIQALKGLAHMQYSRGLKVFCGVNEVSDEDIVRGESETLVYAFDTEKKKKIWETVKKFGQQKILLTAIDGGVSPEAAVAVVEMGCCPMTGEQFFERNELTDEDVMRGDSGEVLPELVCSFPDFAVMRRPSVATTLAPGGILSSFLPPTGAAPIGAWGAFLPFLAPQGTVVHEVNCTVLQFAQKLLE